MWFDIWILRGTDELMGVGGTHKLVVVHLVDEGQASSRKGFL